MESLKKLIKGKKQVAPAPAPAPPPPTAEQIAKSKEEALEGTYAEAERLFKLEEKGGRRRRKTRRGRKVRRTRASRKSRR
jgi:hypothetical protein